MAAPLKNKLSKSERKLLKKCNKSRSTLLRHDGIESVAKPSKILCVSNAGLDNRVSQDEVHKLFSCHGNIFDVIMLPRKPYAFVCFSTEKEAESAYTALNGFKLAAAEDRKEEITLYISYVSRAPASIQPSTTVPPGLILLEDFITDEYADGIMSSINWDTGGKDQEKELKHRKVKHYGYEFKYSINNVDPDDPLDEGIPEMYKKLLDKALETGHVKFYPDQLTINQYQPGQGIPPHVDTTSAFEDGLMSLSIGSQVNMEFRHPDGRLLSVLLPPNSLLIMTGESRYVWSHGITPRKHDIIPAPGGGLTLSKRGIRTSLTFRKITGVRPGETDGILKPDVLISDTDAAELEKQHVHQVYEEIASHFSGTRHTPWPNIVEFLQQQEPGSILADFGCGNGKYFGINKTFYEIGSDRSFNLAEICKERKFEVFVGDILSIPLRSDVFDVCLCIAVIHHLATEERRLKAIEELTKILRPGGKTLIYVWAMEQELNKVKSKYLKKGHDNGNSSQSNISDKQMEAIREKFQYNQNIKECEQIYVFKDHVDSLAESQGHLTSEKGKDNNLYTNFYGGDTTLVQNSAFFDKNSNTKHSQGDQDKVSAEKTCQIGKASESNETDSQNPVGINISGDKCEIRSESQGYCKVKNDCDTRIKESYETNNETKLRTNSAENQYPDCVSENLKASSNTCYENDQEVSGITEECKTAMNENAVKPKLQVHVNRTEFKQQDLLVPWQLKGKKKPELKNTSDNTFHRFYHVFKKGELELLCSKVPSCKILHSYYDQGNWAVILEKL